MNNRYERKMSFKAARKARATFNNSNFNAKNGKMMRKDKKEALRQIRDGGY
jgi:hypothetical protein